MGRRNVDFEGVTSLDYGYSHWYDHWWVIVRLKGSIWPSSLFTVVLSMVATVLYHYFIFESSAKSDKIITNPTVFAFYMQTAGIVLAFMTSICYGRYWEGLTALCQMGQSLTNLTSLAFSFEREDSLVIDGLSGTQWKAQLIHTVSLLHATCISCLKSEDSIVGRPLDVFGGITVHERDELMSVEDQTALVSFWLQDLLASRVYNGGMNIKNPTAVAQVWVCWVTFANALAASKRITQFPLPLPLHHCLAFSDIFVAFISPLVIAAFVPNLTVSLLIVFATSLAYHGLFVINVVALQQPFGSRTYHLPLAMLHRQVIKGMLSLVSHEIAWELISFFAEEDDSPTKNSLGTSSNSRHPDTEFVFPPVDTTYIAESVEKRKGDRRIPMNVLQQVMVAKSNHAEVGQAKKPAGTVGIPKLNHSASLVISPMMGDVAPTASARHPALIKMNTAGG